MSAVLVAWVLVITPASAQAEDSRECQAPEDAAPIIQRREAFNVAIRQADLATVEAVLTEDVVLVAGTHSDLFLDRSAQLDIWRTEFEKGAERLIYVRTPECIERSDVAPIALEHGHWRGQGTAETFASGRYAAKWRQVDGEWRIEAELFMTDRCGGEACPD